MTKPFQHIFCATDLDPVTDHRAVDHHDRKLELARSDKLCLGARATGVLAHNKVDHVRLHQQPITFSRKRPAIDDKVVGGQAWGRSRRVNKAQQVVMLRLCGKGRMRRGVPASLATAAAVSLTHVQRSPDPASHAGLVKAIWAIPAIRAAFMACALIVAAKGCVASTRCVMRWSWR